MIKYGTNTKSTDKEETESDEESLEIASGDGLDHDSSSSEST